MSLSNWLPPNISTYGADIDGMFYLIYYVTGAVFILVALTMIAFLVMYRDKGDGRRAIYSHGNNTLEVIWTVIPAVVFILLALAGARSWAAIKINMPKPDMKVRVHAKQFEWRFIYDPGPDGKYGRWDGTKWTAESKDDVFDENGLRVPVNKVVLLELTAGDVIHSFFVPQLRLKQDTLPGRTIPAWFEATQIGNYEIACAELCGFGHTTMAGTPRGDNPVMGGGLHVLSQADFDEWARKKSPRLAPGGGAAAAPSPAPAAPSPSPSAP